MDFSQIIGFIISLLAIIFLMSRKALDERHRRQHPEEYADEQAKKENELKKFLKSMNIDIEDEEQFSPIQKPEVRPIPPQLPKKNKPKHQPKAHPERTLSNNYQFKTSLEHFKPETSIEKRQFTTAIDARRPVYSEDSLISHDLQNANAYEIRDRYNPSRAEALIRRLPSKKYMIILQEIMNKPKGF